MKTFSLALRNLLRNRRRSLTTLFAMGIGAVTILIFGGYSRDITYGLQTADLHASQVSVDDELRPSFTLHTPWGSVADVRLSARGVHNVGNALAAVAASVAAGSALDDAVVGLTQAAMSPWRMELMRSATGTRIINDAYNAGPASMRAALDALDGELRLARLATQRRTH